MQYLLDDVPYDGVYVLGKHEEYFAFLQPQVMSHGLLILIQDLKHFWGDPSRRVDLGLERSQCLSCLIVTYHEVLAGCIIGA